MTLLVHAFVYEEDGTSRILDDPGAGSDMAGTESCRLPPYARTGPRG
jgi:hypothetical protein